MNTFFSWNYIVIGLALAAIGAQGADLPSGLLAGLYSEAISANQQFSDLKSDSSARKQVALSFIYWVNSMCEPMVHNRMTPVEKHIRVHLWEHRAKLEELSEDPLGILDKRYWGDDKNDVLLRKRLSYGFNSMTDQNSPVFASVESYKKASSDFRKWVVSLWQERAK